MSLRIKIFSRNDASDLEDDINEWLEEWEESIEIGKTHFSIARGGEYYTTMQHGAMIYYRVVNKRKTLTERIVV